MGNDRIQDMVEALKGTIFMKDSAPETLKVIVRDEKNRVIETVIYQVVKRIKP